MPKRVPTKKAARKKTSEDAVIRTRQIAERAKPNMRVAEITPQPDELNASPDATIPDIEHAHSKYGINAESSGSSAKDLHMVVMEPKNATDTRAGRQRKTLIVDDEKVVGEQG